jgi:hypothetical protein
MTSPPAPRSTRAAAWSSRTAEAHHTFGLVHTWLGTVLGETIGYALTATFTVLITVAVAPRWMSHLGYASAALIATGVVIPLGLEAASLTNFAGYVAWCLWLIAMAVIRWRTPLAIPGSRTATAAGSSPVGPALGAAPGGEQCHPREVEPGRGLVGADRRGEPGPQLPPGRFGQGGEPVGQRPGEGGRPGPPGVE